jgi:ribonuclease BN (tRNA processing enzyme)
MDIDKAAPEWISGAALAWEADLLIHDCQYTETEYAARVGFGHSSTAHVAAFANKVGARRLAMFHHDPMHSDDQLVEMRERVLERLGTDTERVVIAAEGADLALPSSTPW